MAFANKERHRVESLSMRSKSRIGKARQNIRIDEIVHSPRSA
jgi:hypothetical protein